jgi:hypothetical protein
VTVRVGLSVGVRVRKRVRVRMRVRIRKLTYISVFLYLVKAIYKIITGLNQVWTGYRPVWFKPITTGLKTLTGPHKTGALVL